MDDNDMEYDDFDDGESSANREVDSFGKFIIMNGKLCIEYTVYWMNDYTEEKGQCSSIEYEFDRKEVEQIRRFAAGEYRGYHRPSAVNTCDLYSVCVPTVKDNSNFYKELRYLLKQIHVYLPKE